MKCKICNSDTNLFDKAIIMNKYKVNYFHCPNCGFIQTEEPFWLQEAYSEAISDSDIGLISRNINLSIKVDTILKVLNSSSTLLDYGGGYGIFVRMMRDKGWDFEWYDKYCNNLFAQGHEKKKKHYDVVTSFEMLEHLENPFETLDEFFSIADTLFCTTELIPQNPPLIKDWWYYATETGQHISFYTHKSLALIAEKYKKYFFSGFGLHILSGNPIPIRQIKFTFNHPHFAKKLFKIYDRPSLLSSDYFELTGKSL